MISTIHLIWVASTGPGDARPSQPRHKMNHSIKTNSWPCTVNLKSPKCSTLPANDISRIINLNTQCSKKLQLFIRDKTLKFNYRSNHLPIIIEVIGKFSTYKSDIYHTSAQFSLGFIIIEFSKGSHLKWNWRWHSATRSWWGCIGRNHCQPHVTGSGVFWRITEITKPAVVKSITNSVLITALSHGLIFMVLYGYCRDL